MKTSQLTKIGSRSLAWGSQDIHIVAIRCERDSVRKAFFRTSFFRGLSYISKTYSLYNILLQFILKLNIIFQLLISD